MDKEIWKDVVGYEGYYRVSSIGRVKSCDRMVKRDGVRMRKRKSQLISGCVNGSGYVLVLLHRYAERKNKNIHRLVAEAFIPNPDNEPQVNHIDGDKTNNNVTNLEWSNQSKNQIHAHKVGLQVNRKGRDSEFSKTTIQLSIDYEFIKEFGATMDVERELGIPNPNVSRSCRNQGMYIAGGFRWMYADEYYKTK